MAECRAGERMNKYVCGEKGCNEMESLVSCRLLMFKGDVSVWWMFQNYGLKTAWEFWRKGYADTYDDYCADHCQKNGFCYGCGEFWAGSESFDFSRNGLCSNCKDDPDLVGYDYDEDYYEIPDDYYMQVDE